MEEGIDSVDTGFRNYFVFVSFLFQSNVASSGRTQQREMNFRLLIWSISSHTNKRDIKQFFCLCFQMAEFKTCTVIAAIKREMIKIIAIPNRFWMDAIYIYR